MMRTLTASLAGLLILAVAPPVPAQQDPSGCSGASMIFNLFVERADGSNAGAAVSPCETLIYQGTLTGGSTGNCCFQGGTVTITTPDGVAHDVTPLGGVPKKCPGDVPADTLAVQYQVRSQDIVNGGIVARFDFTAAESFTGTPPSTGVPIGSTSFLSPVVPCPASTPCLTSLCDPNLQRTGADTGRMGLCTTTPVTDSTPCSADNAGNPVTAIPGGCKTPGCEAGECVTQHIAVTDSTPCSADNAGNPVTAIPGSCKPPGCEAGVCVQAHINVTDSTPCTDADDNACTTAGCEAGSCVQTHVTTTCADPICQQCDTSTGLCGPITPTPPQCVGHPPPTTTTSSSTTTTTTTLPGCADFPCGDDGWAVSICHIPPGNPRKSQTLCIGSDAVSSHLNHGDHCGPCR